jgi:uncharacterized protein YbjT (DUF2867 family)
MNQERESIIVCGATGNQGGAVVESLLSSNRWNVTALSRDPTSEKAKKLEAKGVNLKKGDLLDRASLVGVFQDAQGVFGVTQPWSSDYKKADIKSELRQGKNIIDACREATIQHVVFSTVLHLGMERTGIPHVDSKIELEEYAMKSGIPVTFLQPASFMDNMGQAYFPIQKGKVRGYVDADAKVPYICCRDIGIIAAKVFEEGKSQIGRQILLISDFVSGNDLCEILSRLRNGEQFRYSAIPKLFMRLFANDFYRMRIAFEKYGRPPYPKQLVDALEHCRSEYPKILSVEQFLKLRGFDTKQL